MITRRTGYTLGLIAFVVLSVAFAQTPTVIHYRGHLEVPTVVPAGTVQRALTFNLYEVEFGGSPIWTETQMLDIYDGNFAVLLGTINSVTPELFVGEYRYLGVTVGTGDELSPRQRIAAVPYAMRTTRSATAEVALYAEDAAMLGGGAITVDALSNVLIGTVTPEELLSVGGNADVSGYAKVDGGISVGGRYDPNGNLFVHKNAGISNDIYWDPTARLHVNVWQLLGYPSSDTKFRVDTTTYPFGGTPWTNTHLIVTSNGWVGINTPDPAGTLDVNGPIYQRGVVRHADYVFEEGYELESIEEHGRQMWAEKHLPALPARQVDENGLEIVEIGDQQVGILEELEKAHIYIEQLSQKINQLEKEMESLKNVTQE